MTFASFTPLLDLYHDLIHILTYFYHGVKLNLPFPENKSLIYSGALTGFFESLVFNFSVKTPFAVSKLCETFFQKFSAKMLISVQIGQ
jgi:hypothetical protein